MKTDEIVHQIKQERFKLLQLLARRDDYIKKLSKTKQRYIKKIPIINPNWTYEELLENFAINIWEKLSKEVS